jgi:hypothetical protein
MILRLAFASLAATFFAFGAVSVVAAQSTGQQVSLAPGTSFVVKLLTNLDCRSAKVGDASETQVVENVKNGGETVLKKGAHVTGRVVAVQPPSSSQPRATVSIVFDSVADKGSGSKTLRTVIVALAPEAEVSSSSLSEGRGMGGLTVNAGVSGRGEAGQRRELSRDAVGVVNLPGLELAARSSSSGMTSVISWSNPDIKIKKGSQLVLRVVAS